jgi:WD40 repeat protein
MIEKKSENQKRKPLGLVIFIMIIVVLCVTSLGMFYAWFFLRDSSKAPIKETQTASELSYEQGPYSDYARLPTAQSDLVISPDGRYIAYSYNEKDIVIWDVLSRQELKKLQGHDDSITSIRFSPDGKFLASSARDKTVIVWDFLAGSIVHRLAVNDICGITFLDVGKTLATDCSGIRDLVYWDVSSGEKVRDFLGFLPESSRIEFSPTESTLLRYSSSFQNLFIYDRRSYEQQRTFSFDPPSEVVSAVFLPDGKNVVAAFLDGKVGNWDITTGELGWQKHYTEETQPEQIFISPNDTKPYVIFLKKDGTADLLEIESENIRTIDQSFYTTAAFSPDNQFFALGNAYTMVELWELSGSSPVQYLTGGQHSPPKKIVFSSTGDLLIVVPFEGETRIYQRN